MNPEPEDDWDRRTVVFVNNPDFDWEDWEDILADVDHTVCELEPLTRDEVSLPVTPERAAEVLAWARRRPGWVESPAAFVARTWQPCETCQGTRQIATLPCACRAHVDDCVVLEECRACRGEGGEVIGSRVVFPVE